ncbi:hypothetical protein D3C78_1071040 [compost metagenome]
MVAKIAVVIQTSGGGQREVRHHHPRIFGKQRPTIAGDFTDRRDARRFFVLDAKGVIQLIARPVCAKRELVIPQRESVRAVSFNVTLLDKLRAHPRDAIFRFGFFVTDVVLHFQQIIAIPRMLGKRCRIAVKAPIPLLVVM